MLRMCNIVFEKSILYILLNKEFGVYGVVASNQVILGQSNKDTNMRMKKTPSQKTTPNNRMYDRFKNRTTFHYNT